MSPEFSHKSEEPSFADKVRDALLRAAPEHGDLIRGRDLVVETYCAERGITKDDITIPQLLEIRALPQWQDPFGTTQV